VQSVPLVLGPADGGPRRRPQPDRAPAPVDRDIYELTVEEKAGIAGTPGSLEEALDALEADHEFLLRGDVFTPDVIAAHLELKRAGAKEVALRPHPYEFYLYSEL
jgi:glutamine synthetase